MGDDIDGNFGVGCPEREIGGFAGSSVALSADGLRVALNDKNEVRVFDYDGESWTQVGNDLVQTYRGIASLSISSDGNRLVIGNPGYRVSGNEGSITIYDYISGEWVETNDFFGVGEADQLGSSVAISGDGNTIIAGATTSTPYVDTPAGNGYVQIYSLNNTIWSETATFNGDASGDFFGSYVASSNDGTTVAIGATLSKSVGIVRVMGINSCNDSPVRFRTRKPTGEIIWRDCGWVANKSTSWRCTFEGVSSICRATCNSCNPCHDATNRFRVTYQGRNIARDCDWVANRATKSRCKSSGVPVTCPVACDAC